MEITKVNKENYENLPYKSKSFEQSQPFRMKNVMSYLGFETPDLDTARVLEIGCSYGGNIISYAVFHENAEVYGIDLSETQINEGKRIVEKIGLKNCHLHQKNILEYEGEFGKFDYIICHGVFSWVPDIVKEKIIKVIRSSLSENGVAHISYNTYPGWKYLDIYKEAGFFRKEYLEKRGLKLNSLDTVSIGRGIYEFLKDNTFLDPITRNKAEYILESEPYYIYHEYFEETNDPMYLYDFNEMLKKEGLHHISDTNIRLSLIPNEHVEKLNIECGNDFVAKEQYMDFLNNTQFRNSIITHGENVAKTKRTNDLIYGDFNKIYIRKKFGDEIKDTEFDKFLKASYPRYIKVEEIMKLENIDKGELISNILSNNVDIEQKETRYEIEGNLKLKKNYLNYFKYFLEEQNSPIGISFKMGRVVNVSDEEKKLFLKFDGSRNFEEILNHIKEEYEMGIMSLTIRNGEDVETYLRRYLENIIDFGKNYEIFE